MIFKETLNKLSPSVKAAIEEVYKTAYDKQTHPQDLLLVLEHGFYNEELIKFSDGKNKYSPYAIGTEWIGIAEQTQYKFYDVVRRNIQPNREAFLVEIQNEIRELQDKKTLGEKEEASIHFELMVYLKFWESEKIIKALIQLTRLAQGLNYDWHFDVEDYKEKTGKGREHLIRIEIRDKLDKLCPNFYALVKKNYSSQIRNAIGHSQYAFLNRRISLTNYHEDAKKYRPIQSLSYEEWEERFHDIVLIYNFMIGQEIHYRKLYEEAAFEKQNGLPIRITKTDNSEETRWIKCDPHNKVWRYHKP